MTVDLQTVVVEQLLEAESSLIQRNVRYVSEQVEKLHRG